MQCHSRDKKRVEDHKKEKTDSTQEASCLLEDRLVVSVFAFILTVFTIIIVLTAF